MYIPENTTYNSLIHIFPQSAFNLNKIYTICDSKLVCQKESTSLPREFSHEDFYILLGIKERKVDIYFLKKENKTTINNRELILTGYDELKQTLIYKEINSNYKKSLSNIYSKKIPKKTNSKIIMDFFNENNINQIISETLYFTNISLDISNIYIAKRIMIEEYNLINNSYYDISINTSILGAPFYYKDMTNNEIIEKLYHMGEISRLKKLIFENYYSNQKVNQYSNQVQLSIHIKNLNDILSQLKSEKKIKLNNDNFNYISGDNILYLDLPVDYLLKPIISKIDLIQGMNGLGFDMENLTKTISDKYNNLNHSENELSRILRLSILINTIINF